MKRHIKSVHEKTEQFPCQLCGKIFTRSDILIKHVRVKHKLKCSYCDTAFEEYGHWKSHMQTEHKEMNRFTCQYCDKYFGKAYDRKRHIESVHLKLKQFE